MCRNVVDLAIMYQTMSGCEPHKIDADLKTTSGMFCEMARGVKGLVIGVITKTERIIVDANILDSYDEAIARLRELGALIKPLNFPRSLEDMRSGVATFIGVECYYYYHEMYETQIIKWTKTSKYGSWLLTMKPNKSTSTPCAPASLIVHNLLMQWMVWPHC